MNKETQIVNRISEILKLAESVIKEQIQEELILDYVDIFPKSEEERISLQEVLNKLGSEICKTKTGPTYLLSKPLPTKFGPLKLVRVRIYDKQKKQKGAPDFEVKNYKKFKEKYLKKQCFHLIERPKYEMIELNVKNSNVLIYFPNETLSESLGLITS